MAIAERKPVQFSLPYLTPSSFNKHAFLSVKTSRTRVTNTRILKSPPHNVPHQPCERNRQFKSATAASFAHSGLPDGVDRGPTARAEGRNDDADGDLPALELLGLRNLDKPALDVTGMHINQTSPGLRELQGDSRGSHDRPLIIEEDEPDETDIEDEAEDTSGSRDANAMSPHNALATSELASGSDLISQQDTGNIAQSTSVESALRSLPKPSGKGGDDGWTKDEQVKSPPASAPSSPRPRSVEVSQDEIESQQRSGATSSKPELRDASQHGTPDQRLEEGRQRENMVVK
ncbi:uncharacterized protein BP5553_07430 [Venustampulla echinocandica]|uniref:Uncharacterized protein n=1 Tax=Venustampulla echinocandica TaxID=2656787 RepID=A0A370TJG5_9HELO|nr:uncharacterized protein BP5553_07430 [Venustampulla echinocandica]RDL35499.1 hypothetical protein BP5553_07430 [Venustampulla echinocandica]